MGENVQVIVRVRPHQSESKFSVNAETISTIDGSSKAFTFDHIFDELSSQSMIHEELCSKYVLHTLEGYNACIFAYGQTGSGKTYTMRGKDTNPGIIPLICSDLFEALSLDDSIKTTVTMTYFEIYNEKIIDLLGDTAPRVREKADKKTFIQDITTFQVGTVEEVLKHLNAGDSKRSVASTRMNLESSRSHAIFNLSISQTEQDGSMRESDLKLVDLAGSERANATLGIANGQRMKEGANINKSLSTLGRCISQLAKNSKMLIPYRDSLLTWVLKENLGGNSKTCMIACISPIDLEESLSTLRYATTAKDIKLNAKMNEIIPTVNLDLAAAMEAAAASREELENVRLEMNNLQSELDSKSEQCGTYERLQERFKHINKLNDYLEVQLKKEILRSQNLHRDWKLSKIELDNIYRQLLSVMGTMVYQNEAEVNQKANIEQLITDSSDLLLKLDTDISDFLSF